MNLRLNYFLEKDLRELLAKYEKDAYELDIEEVIKLLEKHLNIEVICTGYAKGIGRSFQFAEL